MKLIYFAVDERNELRRAPARKLERIWSGVRSASQLGISLKDELRIISVVHDGDFRPKVTYFLRLDLEDGWVTDDSRFRALEAVEESNRGNLEHLSVAHQLGRWPRDWRTQVAVALDVPAAEVNNIGIGGLLPLADVLGIPVRSLLGYFAQAFQES